MKKTISVLLAVAMIFSLCACSQNKQSGISIKPTEFSEETLEVLDLFDDEIQFFDISLDENVKSFESSVWVYRDGEWFEDGKTHGNNDFLGKRIAIRLTENSYELYNICRTEHKNKIPKIRPLTGRTMRKVDGLFLSAKSKKEVNYNDKTENP